MIKKIVLLLFINFCAPLYLFAQSGTFALSGILTDVNTKEPLAGVSLSIVETNSGTQTDANGRFALRVKPGRYTLLASYLGYIKESRTIEVNKNLATLNIRLKSAARSLSGISVEATRVVKSEKALLDLRRKSAVIQDAIGAEQIEKTASITTAQALQRVTGVSVRDGKYITVRGLTDRNLVVQLNGARLSSANSERSAVPLDIIPAQLLENITVEKTVTPDKPGDATGAIVEIKTKSIPESSFYQFSAQSGFNSNVGFLGKYNSYPDAGLGAIGTKVQNLNLSTDYTTVVGAYQARGYSIVTGTLRSGLTATINRANINSLDYNDAISIDRAAKSFSPYVTPTLGTASPNQIYNFTYGNRFRLKGDRLIGLIIGLNYYNRYQSNPQGENNLYSTREVSATSPNVISPNELNVIPIFRYRESTGTHSLNYGALVTTAFRYLPGNEVSLSYNGNFGADAVASTFVGENNATLIPVNADAPSLLRPRSTVYNLVLHSTERVLHTFQLKGENRFGGGTFSPRLSWTASSSYSRQNDPNYRNTRVLLDSAGTVPNPVLGPNLPARVTSDYGFTYNVKLNEYYRLLKEQNQNYKADLTLPAKIFSTIFSFKTGAYLLRRRRTYNESTKRRQDEGVLVRNNSVAGIGQQAGNATTLLGNLDRWNSTDLGVGFNQSRSEGSPLQSLYIPIAEPGTNSFNASQQVFALYGMSDFTLGKSWRFIGGLRIEGTDFQAQPDTTGTGFARFPGTSVRIQSQDEFNRLYVTNYLTYAWLPSGSFIYNGIKNVGLRLAYGKTLTRPELNEIIQTSQNDPLQQAFIQGNKELKNGEFSAYDFRADYFLRPEELISISAYFKQVKSQIERIYLPAGQNRIPTGGGAAVVANTSQVDQFGDASSTITFRNNPNKGYVYGLEFEIRKKLDQLFPFGKNLIIGTNLLIARSTTKLADAEYYVGSLLDTRLPHSRPLIDQPNYALNVNIGFEEPKWGTKFNLLYNRTGKRLIIVNVDGTPNIYEYPAGALDATYSQQFGKRWQLKAFAKNLLNEPTQYIYTTAANSKYYGNRGRIAYNRVFTTGAEYTLGVNYTF